MPYQSTIICPDCFNKLTAITKDFKMKAIYKIHFVNSVANAVIDNPDLPIGFIQDLLIVKSEKNPRSEPFILDLNSPIKLRKAL